MASNIVEYLMQFDVSIVWYIRSESVREDKKNKIKKKISRMIKVSPDDLEYVARKQDCVRFTDNIREVRDSDIIIECVSENVESKRDVFNALLDTDALVFSNTSSLPPDSFIPEQLSGQSAGLHFFYPVQLKQFVELNVLENTEKSTVDKMELFVRNIDKRALILTGEHHFVLNRIFLTYLAQSCSAVQMYKIASDRLDREIESSLFPIGPFKFMESVGFDIMSKSVETYIRKCSNPAFFIPLQQLLQNVQMNAGWLNTAESIDDDTVLAGKAAFEVKSVFVNTVYCELAAKYVDYDLLIDAIADYAGMTRDSIDRVLDDITPSMLETLRKLYNATYFNVYRPPMQLLKNIKNPEQRM